MVVLLAHTATKRYIVRNDEITMIRLISKPADLQQIGTPERPAIPVDLGALLNQSDYVRPGRQHGLVVPLRRRPIVFLVERVDNMLDQPVIHPLPSLFAKRISEPWVSGIVLIEEEPVLVVELRTIARSMLAQRSTDR